jgi:hypothetical protein
MPHSSLRDGMCVHDANATEWIEFPKRDVSSTDRRAPHIQSECSTGGP